jgi:hypothetical protein
MTNRYAPSRRALLRAIASTAAVGALGSLGAVSRQARAATADRKFLFFFAGGGWDATPLDPKFGEDGFSPVGGTDMDPLTYRDAIGNLSWSGGPDRENMSVFFRRWGARACIVRGVNVHSAGHESGMKWMMTGSSASSIPDWPTVLAARGQVEYPMPHLVFSGPSYPGNLGAAVVRGGGGTLLRLIDGSLVTMPDDPAPRIAPPSDSMLDALVYARAARFAEDHDGFAARRAEHYLGNLERTMELEGRRFEAGLDDVGRGLLDQALMASEVMRLGLSRCAIIGIPGGWDTHGGNQAVGRQLDSFFGALDQLMEHLAVTPGNATPWLIDEVTVVCTSELGRTPRFNGSMGRDHWPYTSMLLLGSGVRGNAVVGETDEGFLANPVDFATGRASAGGDVIGTEHVGTALLKLGGLDPEDYLPGVRPLDAILR